MALSAQLIFAYILNIGILFFVLWKVLYKPVKKFLDEREARFRNREEDIERRDHDTQEEKARYEELLARNQGATESLMRDARADANRRAEEIIAQAHSEAEEILRQARKQAADEQRLAREEMRDHIVDLAVDMASRILEREVTVEDHQRIVKRFLENEKVG